MKKSFPMYSMVPALVSSLFAGSVSAGSLRVDIAVPSAADGVGQVGCALYASADGFPMDATKARVQTWQPAARNLTCEFSDLPAGDYAVALSHDLNDNQVVDTNWLGMPKEAWGVSRNARPSLRAPRFDEASVAVPAEGQVVIIVEVRK